MRQEVSFTVGVWYWIALHLIFRYVPRHEPVNQRHSELLRREGGEQPRIGRRIEPLMDRYQFSKDSQIINDPNDWAKEHDDPRYILNLLKRIITVSLETMKIVNALPALKQKI